MSATIEAQTYESLSGIPRIDIPSNLNLALSSGRGVFPILREIIALWRGPGKLMPQEYFYYRLWDPTIPLVEKRRFVGKRAQTAMHLACNSQYWYCAAADKILFHTIMSGAAMPIPDLIAISAAGRTIPGVPNLTDVDTLASLLRRPEFYPLFMKEVGGKYSLSVISADTYDPMTDEVVLLGGARRSPESIAGEMLSPRGYLVQRRLRQTPALATLFGPRLWSVRVFVIHGAAGSCIHRATAKIATGSNPADNYWRPGNMLGAIDLNSGQIVRVVRGSGAELQIDDVHPDTGRPIVGVQISEWNRVIEIVLAAAPIFAGIHSQSWDVALTEQGPVLLEVNFGGDLNLTQLVTGNGALDDGYAEHLHEWGYRS
jgi:Sugar-transfer associated ATP-grasp